MRELSRILGVMVAAHPAVLPAPMFYRNLEHARTSAHRRGLSYDSKVEANKEMRLDLRWWMTHLSNHNGRALQITHWDLTIESDASKKGWGPCCQDFQAGGPWTPQEMVHSINYSKEGCPAHCLYLCTMQTIRLLRIQCSLQRSPLAAISLHPRGLSTYAQVTMNYLYPRVQ